MLERYRTTLVLSALVGIVLLSFSLRSSVASLSPLFDFISQDFPLSSLTIGLIGAAPPICYAVFGVVTPWIALRLGERRLAVAVMAVIAFGLVLRGLVGQEHQLVGATFVIFAAIGVGNVILPPLVKKYFPKHVGGMTAVYSTTMVTATLLPPLVAVPSAEAMGWRVAVAWWAVFAVFGVVAWMVLARRGSDRDGRPALVDSEPTERFPSVAMLRLPLFWALTVGFVMQGALAYGAFVWLPIIVVDVAGISSAAGGALLSLYIAAALPCTLFAPRFAKDPRSTGLLFHLAALLSAAGFLGLLLLPGTASWLWVALFGLGGGTVFPLVLTLLGLRARTDAGAIALSGWVQSLGYAIIAAVPLSLGILHEMTGSWDLPLIVLIVISLTAAPAGFILARTTTIEDALAHHRLRANA